MRSGRFEATMRFGRSHLLQVIACFVLTLPALATVGLGSGENPSSVMIGLSRRQVVQLYGVPQSYFDAGIQAYLKSYPVVPIGLVWEVYRRKTPGNEYRILILYYADYSQSRLHPTARVEEARFEADKPRPARQLLSDLKEARALCAQNCQVQSTGSALRVTAVGKRDCMLLEHWSRDDYSHRSVTSLDDLVTNVLVTDKQSEREGEQVGVWSPPPAAAAPKR